MLATLAGELPNSARYFSTFATVSTEDYRDLVGQFGTGNCKWKAWDYNQRVKVAESVAKLKENLSKHLTPKTFCSKGLLKEAISKSKLPDTSKTFADVPVESCFHRVITALRYEMKCSCLARKVVKWYGETQGKGADLQYRFTVGLRLQLSSSWSLGENVNFRANALLLPLWSHQQFGHSGMSSSAHGTAVPEISPGTRYSDNGGERGKAYCCQETVREQLI
ncbi:hypothetical protein OS493_008050 [Desmophyllum pertusum]|uniref:Uncharacterized protein n=1 Tax=Desmophyllum pertusum TaxID=174260 RepID=A0A9X0CGD3_9CNID|nr:hypothetical protein OS493_008050 [Desmophyllum pertusum]